MEFILAIAVAFFSLSVALEKASGFIQQLKSGSAKLSKGLEANLSITPIDKKSEECGSNTNSADECDE